jgi:hypothetical protein
MKRVMPPRPPNDWVAHQLKENPANAAITQERRHRFDRRHRVYWSIVYGGFYPRRRRPPRRLDDSRFHSLDWHAAHLLAVAIGIMLLSVADAFLTVTLLSIGAYEANPFMAPLLDGNATIFAALKVGMTAVSVLVMVALARYRFMRFVRVEVILYSVLALYFALIGYELWMLQARISLPSP